MATTKIKDVEVRFEPEVEMSDQVKKLIEKKRRNMEKRKNRLEEYKKRSDKGEKLLPEQAEALSNYANVLESLQTLQSLLDQIQQLYALQARWLKKERKTSLKKGGKQSKDQPPSVEAESNRQEASAPAAVEPSHGEAAPAPPVAPAPPAVDVSATIQESLSKQGRIFRLLQCFGDEEVRQKFLSSTEENRTNLANLTAQGLVPVQQTDIDWLDEAFGLLNPLAEMAIGSPTDVFGCLAPLTSHEVSEILAPSHEQWTALMQRRNSAMLADGTSYALVAELIDRLLACKFFGEWKPSPAVEQPPLPQQSAYEIPVSVMTVGPSSIATSFPTATPPPGFTVSSTGAIGSPVSHHGVTVTAPLNSNRYPSGGGVDGMLQKLDTSYHFMQHPATPTQENVPAFHEPSQPQVQQNRVAAYQPAPQPPVAVPSYWGSADVNANRSGGAGSMPLGSENVLLTTKPVAPVHSDWSAVQTFDSDPIPEHFAQHTEPSTLVHQTQSQHSHGGGESRERIASGVSSGAGAVGASIQPQQRVASPEVVPPANLSWADKVRFNATGGSGGSAIGGTVGGGLSFSKTPSTSEAPVSGGPSGMGGSQQGAGDVFTTASQSQFLVTEGSGEHGGGYRRRGGGGGGRGFYGGDRGRGREGGFRGSWRGGRGSQNGPRGGGGRGGHGQN